MKIGIDIDGVILDFEGELRVQAELNDVIETALNEILKGFPGIK